MALIKDMQGDHDGAIRLLLKHNRISDALKYAARYESAKIPLSKVHQVRYLKIRGNRSETEAKASLVYGMAIQDHTMLKSALSFYKKNSFNLFGEIEAFNIAIARSGYTCSEKIEDLIQALLLACEQVKTITTTSKTTSGYILSQIEAFYGFQKTLLGQVYSVPPSSYPWTNELLKEIDSKDVTVDADGMLQLKVEVVLTAICIRFNTFRRKWIIDDKFRLVNTFYEALGKHPLHQQMISGGYLTKSISENSLFQGYINMLSSAFDTLRYGNSQLFTQNDIVKATLSALSPQATCYLAATYFYISSKHLILTLHEKVRNILKESDIYFNLDKWLEAWRIGCVTGEELLKVSVLNARADRYQEAKTVFCRPPVYVLDNTKEYKHLMLLWLEACKLLREEKILDCCKIVVHNIICHVASHRTIRHKLSISNLLHIATIHTTAIMAMYASYLACSQYEGTFYVPSSYKRVIDVFQKMNSVLGKKKTDILRLCIADVKRRKDRSKLPSDFFDLLSIILRVMIGMYDGDFNPLKYALSNKDCLKNHEAHHCLIFVLILFGNIGQMKLCSDHNLQVYRSRICESIEHCEEPALKEAYRQFATSATIVDCYRATKRLLEASNDNLTCVNFYFEHIFMDISFKFNPAYLQQIYQRDLPPLPVQTKLRATAKEFYPQLLNLSSQTSHESVDSDTVPQLHTLESVEAEDNDHETVDKALEITESTDQNTTSKPLDESDPMVNEMMCGICACPLKPDSSQHDPSSASNLETYSHHIHTERHLVKAEMYNRFQAEVNDYYNPKKQALGELLLNGAELNKVVTELDIKLELGSIEKELKDSDHEVEMIQCSAEWNQGVRLISDLSGKMESLHRRLNRIVEQKERETLAIEKAKEQEAKKGEEIENEESEDEEIENAELNNGYTDRRRKRMIAKRRKVVI